jgi:PAS domain S-box-containing protein
MDFESFDTYGKIAGAVIGGGVFIYKIGLHLHRLRKRKLEAEQKMADHIEFIFTELKPNHGSSLKDQVNKIQNDINENTSFTKQICHRQRWILDNREEPIFECNGYGEYSWVNEKYKELVNYDSKDLLGHGWKNIIHSEDRDRVCHEWDSAIADKRNSNCSYRIVTKDGQIYNVSSVAIRTDSLGYIGAFKVVQYLVK